MGTAKKATLEDAWAVVRELGALQKETSKELKESQKETERVLRESDEKMSRQLRCLEEAVAETTRSVAETTQTVAETTQTVAETTQTVAETTQTVKEVSQAIDRAGRSIDKVNGNFNTKWGGLLEKLVEGDLLNLLRNRGIAVREVHSNVKSYSADRKYIEAEYDLIAVGGLEVIVVEIKTTLDRKKVGKFIDKMEGFKKRLSLFSNNKVFGAVAYMWADDGAEEKASSGGLFLIRAPGGASNIAAIANPRNFKPRKF